MPCKRCIARGKTWSGDNPNCAFDGNFASNWNCATLNALRDIVYEGQNTMPPGVDYQYCEDMKYATVKIDDIENGGGEKIGMALWVAWYKSRGTTDAVWILDSDREPRIPTEAELDVVISSFAGRQSDLARAVSTPPSSNQPSVP